MTKEGEWKIGSVMDARFLLPPPRRGRMVGVSIDLATPSPTLPLAGGGSNYGHIATIGQTH
jgi:hypothetical protein